MNFPILIMLPPHGSSRCEAFVSEGRLRAAEDLIERLRSLPQVESIFAVYGDSETEQRFSTHNITTIKINVQPFHFGRALAEAVEEIGSKTLAYFGGGSAPLMTQDRLEVTFTQVQLAEGPFALVNNYHSTDWMIINRVKPLQDYAHRLPSDNSLGWVMHHDAGLRVDSLDPDAGTRMDIDTPMDLLMLRGHTGLGQRLRSFLRDAPEESTAKLTAIKDVLCTPASNIMLIGRVPAYTLLQLEKSTQSWTRIYAEERGMVASQRVARGEVQSLMTILYEELGPQRLIDQLASLSDGVFWDTRVWMAANRLWPPNHDRFALDLGWIEEIQQKKLRALAEVIASAPIPILSGGHSVVAGGLCALLDSIPTIRSPSS